MNDSKVDYSSIERLITRGKVIPFSYFTVSDKVLVGEMSEIEDKILGPYEMACFGSPSTEGLMVQDEETKQCCLFSINRRNYNNGDLFSVDYGASVYFHESEKLSQFEVEIFND